MEKNNATLLFMGGIIALIIALALVTPLASEGNKVTTKTIITNEGIDTTSALLGKQYNVTVNLGPVANVPTGWKLEQCPLSSITATNVTGTAVLVVTTDYTLNTKTGVLNMLNSTTNRASFGVGADNKTYVGYQYCQDNYLTQDWARSAVSMTMGFFALACFLASVAMFYGVAKNTGIIGK